jgi:hypothetical protein
MNLYIYKYHISRRTPANPCTTSLPFTFLLKKVAEKGKDGRERIRSFSFKLYLRESLLSYLSEAALGKALGFQDG